MQTREEAREAEECTATEEETSRLCDDKCESLGGPTLVFAVCLVISVILIAVCLLIMDATAEHMELFLLVVVISVVNRLLGLCWWSVNPVDELARELLAVVVREAVLWATLLTLL